MTRIVAGLSGGRTIGVPPRGTRPTSDRVREALFSRLDHAGLLDDTVVLDLYAGSGALGLEAASRGARQVTLVESARGAVAVCRRNVATLGLTGVEVVADRVLSHLRTRRGPAVDLALLDPPYDLDEDALAEALEALVPHLATGATVVVERSSRSAEPRWPARLERSDLRRYGDTALWFGRTAGETEAPVEPALRDRATGESAGPTVAG